MCAVIPRRSTRSLASLALMGLSSTMSANVVSFVFDRYFFLLGFVIMGSFVLPIASIMDLARSVSLMGL